MIANSLIAVINHSRTQLNSTRLNEIKLIWKNNNTANNDVTSDVTYYRGARQTELVSTLIMLT